MLPLPWVPGQDLGVKKVEVMWGDLRQKENLGKNLGASTESEKVHEPLDLSSFGDLKR